MSFQVEMAGTQARDREENPLVPARTAGYTVAAVALGIAEGGVGGAVAEEGVAEVREVAIVTMALGMEVVVGEAGGVGIRFTLVEPIDVPWVRLLAKPSVASTRPSLRPCLHMHILLSLHR